VFDKQLQKKLDRAARYFSGQLKNIRMRYRHQIGTWIAGCADEKCVSVYIWFVHDSVIHKNRDHTISDGRPRLSKLRLSEINLLAEIVGTAASPEFEVEFCGFSDGKAKYHLYPTEFLDRALN
jgi:hypothetical protein